MMFLYRHFPGREHVLLTLQLHWLEGCVVLLVDAISFCFDFFYYLGHVACGTVANFNVVFVKDFGWGGCYWGSACGLSLGSPYLYWMLCIYCKVG